MAMHDSNERASQADDGERHLSTPLRPAVWMTSVLVWATVVALILRVPNWASVFLCTVTGVSFLVFVVGYVYLFANDREALRAERWRGRKARISSRDALAQERSELNEDQQQYLGPGPAGSAFTGTDARATRVSVAEAGRVRQQ